MKNYTIKKIPEDQYHILRILAARRDKSINALFLEIIHSVTTKYGGKDHDDNPRNER